MDEFLKAWTPGNVAWQAFWCITFSRFAWVMIDRYFTDE